MPLGFLPDGGPKPQVLKQADTTSLPIKGYFRYVLSPTLAFDDAGAIIEVRETPTDAETCMSTDSEREIQRQREIET